MEQARFHSPLVASGPSALSSLLARIRDIACNATFFDQVARMHGVLPVELRGECRERRLVQVRDLCAALLYARGVSVAEISRDYLWRDPSTVRSEIRQFFDRDTRSPLTAESWRILAPCSLAAARTYEELVAMMQVRAEPGTDCWMMEAAE